MRLVIQRVSSARVTVAGDVVGEIERGLLVLAAIEDGDSASETSLAADKLSGLRVFADSAGRMNMSVIDVGGDILVVSQFTLLADVSRGKRPSFTAAGDPVLAEAVVEELIEGLRQRGVGVAAGRFGARMTLESVNDGPVTLVVDIRGSRVQPGVGRHGDASGP